MIQLFQEAIPFSSKRVDAPVSKDGSFLNPIIMPFAINTTLGTNVFETVFYIRNTSVENFYNDVVVTLMKEVGNDTSVSNGVINTDEITGDVTFSLNNDTNIPVSKAYPYQGVQSTVKVLNNTYRQNYTPVTDGSDGTVSVKFSYGYDEVSALDWNDLSSVLVIPMIGNSTTPDTSYIPIRMRVTFKTIPTIFTIRDYFLDISYVYEGAVA